MRQTVETLGGGQEGIGERLHILPPVAEHTICGFIAAADASLVLIENVSQSYEFSFPNKLLESLFAGLPVLVSDRVELLRGVFSVMTGRLRDMLTLAAAR